VRHSFLGSGFYLVELLNTEKVKVKLKLKLKSKE